MGRSCLPDCRLVTLVLFLLSLVRKTLMMLVVVVSACVLLPIQAEANSAKLNFCSGVLLLQLWLQLQ